MPVTARSFLDLPRSRQAALKARALKYFSGEPCSHGHVTFRYSSNGTCHECGKRRTAAYRNSAKHKASKDKWYREKLANVPEHMMCIQAKRRAREAGVPFDLTPEAIRAVWPRDNRCPVTLHEFATKGGRGANHDSPSLDRIRPEWGYICGNIAVISRQANWMKSDNIDPAVFRRLADWFDSVRLKGVPLKADFNAQGVLEIRGENMLESMALTTWHKNWIEKNAGLRVHVLTPVTEPVDLDPPTQPAALHLVDS